jgi:hypothetical protein
MFVLYILIVAMFPTLVTSVSLIFIEKRKNKYIVITIMLMIQIIWFYFFVQGDIISVPLGAH